MPEIDGEVKITGDAGQKKVRAIFVGEEMTVADLIKLGPTPIQFAETTIPAAESAYGKVHPQKTPRLLVAWGVEACAYPNFATVVVTSHKSHKLLRLILPLDYKVRVLTGRQGRSMRDEYLAYLEENFLSSYVRPAMTVGADPEFFIETSDRVVPAFEFLPSKKAAEESTVHAGISHVYWDGFQAEFDMPAATCLVEFSRTMRDCLAELQRKAAKKVPGAHISTKTVVQIPQEVLDAAAPEHVEFGCAPSLNAYGLAGGGGHLDGRATPFRFAGGHIHFGVHGIPKEKLVSAVRALDALVAVPCVSLLAEFDNPIRRQFYGLPGEYRLPPHGLEYRTLSNAWLCHPLIYNLVLDLARLAFGVGTCTLLSAWKFEEAEVIETIRKCDVGASRAFMERNQVKFMKLLEKVPAWRAENHRAKILDIFKNGVGSVIAKPTDLVANWRLEHTYNVFAGMPGFNWNSANHEVMAGRRV